MANTNDNVCEVPDGVYRIEVTTKASKILAGYLWTVSDQDTFYNYFVTQAQYLPPISGVETTTFVYAPSEMPSDFGSLAEFLQDASDQIEIQVPGASVEHVAMVEGVTDWALPS
tara:strand:- start:29 stop:370 length:342 start_codon:yes stop_codon:yes gene_type:complete